MNWLIGWKNSASLSRNLINFDGRNRRTGFGIGWKKFKKNNNTRKAIFFIGYGSFRIMGTSSSMVVPARNFHIILTVCERKVRLNSKILSEVRFNSWFICLNSKEISSWISKSEDDFPYPSWCSCFIAKRFWAFIKFRGENIKPMENRLFYTIYLYSYNY